MTSPSICGWHEAATRSSRHRHPVSAGGLGGIKLVVDPLQPLPFGFAGPALGHAEAAGDGADRIEGGGAELLLELVRQGRASLLRGQATDSLQQHESERLACHSGGSDGQNACPGDARVLGLSGWRPLLKAGCELLRILPLLTGSPAMCATGGEDMLGGILNRRRGVANSSAAIDRGPRPLPCKNSVYCYQKQHRS